MIKVYPAVIHDDEYMLWIEFPDLPGCQTDGETPENLMANASEALGLYLAAKMDSGETIPSPSKIRDLNCPGRVVTYVITDVNKYHKSSKAIKKMVSIPEWLAEEADKHNLSLSRVLQEALIERLGLG